MSRSWSWWPCSQRLWGCAQQAPKATTPSAPATKEPVPPPPSQQSSIQEQRPTAQGPSSSVAAPPLTSGPPVNIGEFADAPALKDVFFEPGRADIVRNAATIMLGNARRLVDNRD